MRTDIDRTYSLPPAWSDWEIIEEIGYGATGVVYRIRNAREMRDCAMKVIHVPADDKEAVHACRREIRCLLGLRGLSVIVAVEDFAEATEGEECVFFIRMELLESLADYIQMNGADEELLLLVGRDMATALQELARVGLVHRDLKPENVFRSPQSRFKLGDFGASDVENSLGTSGTPAFQAPELYHGGKGDGRADIYSLGMMLYRLTNRGRDPFLDTEKQMVTREERERAFKRRMAGEPLPRPVEAGDRLAAILMRCCAYAPEDRFASAAQLKAAFSAALSNEVAEPVEAPANRRAKTGTPASKEVAEPVEAPANRHTKNPSHNLMKTAALCAALLTAALVLTITWTLKHARGSAAPTAPVQGTLRVGISMNRIPYSYQLPEGTDTQYIGSDVRLAEHLAAHLAAQLSQEAQIAPFYGTDWPGNDSGCTLLLAAATAYDFAAKGIPWSEAYYVSAEEEPYAVAVPAEKLSRYRTALSLQDKTFCALRGSVSATVLSARYAGALLIEANSFAEAVEDVLTGKADALLIPLREAGAWLSDLPYTLSVTTVRATLPVPPLVVGLPTEDEALTTAVNTACKALREAQGYDKWREEAIETFKELLAPEKE